MEAKMMVFQNKTMCLIICKTGQELPANKYSQDYFVTNSNSGGAVKKGEVLRGFEC